MACPRMLESTRSHLFPAFPAHAVTHEINSTTCNLLHIYRSHVFLIYISQNLLVFVPQILLLCVHLHLDVMRVLTLTPSHLEYYIM